MPTALALVPSMYMSKDFGENWGAMPLRRLKQSYASGIAGSLTRKPYPPSCKRGRLPASHRIAMIVGGL